MERREYDHAFYLSHRERILERQKEHNQRPEVKARRRPYVREYMRTYRDWPKQRAYRQRYMKAYHQRPEVKARNRQLLRERYLKYGDQIRAKERVRRKALREELRRKLIEGLGGACSCCGESRPEFLTLEHVKRDGKQHRHSRRNHQYRVYRDVIEQGFPRDKYTLLCWNCNTVKRFGDPCPHELERQEKGVS